MKLPRTFMLMALGAAMLLAGVPYFSTAGKKGLHLETLVIEGKLGSRHSFEVEIAATPQAAKTGLMFREQMDPDRGMLFVFAREGVARFWMKNTLIPLDMLFIAADGEIKTIHENAVPMSLEGISSEAPVLGVLEINGGRAQELGIMRGDKVVHAYFKKSND